MLNRKEQERVLELVKGTKELILRELENARVTEKGAADYVTNVDLAVQEYLRQELGRDFPDIAMIAEEKENRDLKRDGRYWILDPIDGTTNLIHHYGISAVALALYERGEITFSAVYNPFREELFYGVRGGGAYFNGAAIHVNDRIALKDAVVSFGSSPYEKERAKDIFPVFYRIFTSCADFRRTGSAELDICYVACGRQHGFVEQNLKPWDYSAGSLILEEAGGVISRWDGTPVPYLYNSDVAASTGALRGELLRLLEREQSPSSAAEEGTPDGNRN